MKLPIASGCNWTCCMHYMIKDSTLWVLASRLNLVQQNHCSGRLSKWQHWDNWDQLLDAHPGVQVAVQADMLACQCRLQGMTTLLMKASGRNWWQLCANPLDPLPPQTPFTGLLACPRPGLARSCAAFSAKLQTSRSHGKTGWFP